MDRRGSDVKDWPAPMNSGSSDAVYRSLAVPAPRVQHSVVRSNVEVKQSASTVPALVAAGSSSFSGAVGTKFPILPVPLEHYPLPTWHSWICDPSLTEDKLCAIVEEALRAQSCQVVKYQDECMFKFACAVNGSRCSERCTFDVNIWDLQSELGASGRFLLECERRSGDPFLYNAVISQASMFTGNNANGGNNRARQFVVPDLPKECLDNGEGCRMECVERLIEAATNPVDYEERLQACCLLADLLQRDQTIIGKFRQAKCKERVSKNLSLDTDPVIRNAVTRIVAALG